jgi:hypothetical protein
MYKDTSHNTPVQGHAWQYNCSPDQEGHAWQYNCTQVQKGHAGKYNCTPVQCHAW